MFKYFICFVVLILFTETIVGQKKYKTEKSCKTIKSFLFKENEKSHRMVEIIFNSDDSINDCFVYGNRNIAEEVISKKLCSPQVVYVERKTLSEWALKCSQWLSNAMKNGNIETYSDEDFPEEYNNKIDRNFFDGIMIFPGTKWCGAGDIAEHHDDLGNEEETDKCCRAHDHCFDDIPSKETKYNLTNKAIHTKSHCECDQQFRECLQSISNSVSQKVAKLFFNLIQIQCFKKDYPIVECLEYKGIPFFWRSCQKYLLDFNKQMIYQFFDAIFI